RGDVLRGTDSIYFLSSLGQGQGLVRSLLQKKRVQVTGNRFCAPGRPDNCQAQSGGNDAWWRKILFHRNRHQEWACQRACREEINTFDLSRWYWVFPCSLKQPNR